MRKVTLIFGLLAGAIVSIFLVIGIALWEKSGVVVDNALVGYATMVIALSMVFFGIKPVGILITLISAAVLRKKEFLPA